MQTHRISFEDQESTKALKSSQTGSEGFFRFNSGFDLIWDLGINAASTPKRGL